MKLLKTKRMPKIINNVHIEETTLKAYKIIVESVPMWIPKSVVIGTIQEDGGGLTLELADWWANTMHIVGATFSDDRTRRLQLWRVWDKNKKQVLCIGLNPSTAKDYDNDQTIGRLTQYLRELGYGGLRMVNLFTAVSSSPKILLNDVTKQHEEEDLGIIFGNSLVCDEIIFCWGTFKEARARAHKVASFFGHRALCFGRTKIGAPWHPLACFYAGLTTKTVKLFPFNTHKFENNLAGTNTERKRRRKMERKAKLII